MCNTHGHASDYCKSMDATKWATMAEKESTAAAQANRPFHDRFGKPFTGSQANKSKYLEGRCVGGNKKPFVRWTKEELDKRAANKDGEWAKRTQAIQPIQARHPNMAPDPL